MKTVVNAAATGGVKKIFELEHSTSLHTVQTVFTGSITALTIDLEGSLDGTTFFQLAQDAFSEAEITAKAAMFHVVDKLVEYIRINISTLTGTGTVTCKYSPATSAMRQVD